jgi:alkyl sulfatase BDS1-like metallo-beta-lactamase superfamily hydrolase
MGGWAILERARKDFIKANSASWRRRSAISYSPSRTIGRPARCCRYPGQLGYVSENATWLNAYLFGAQELRQEHAGAAACSDAARTLAALRTEQLWDVLGVRLSGRRPKANT